MKKTLLAIAVVVCFASVAHAAPITFQAFLSGPNENPPNASPGIGFALVTIDPVANTMLVQATFGGLLGTTTAAHIHCCVVAPGTAGVATTTPSFPGFPLGVTFGSMDQLFNMTLAGSYNPAFLNNATNGGSTATAQATLFNAIMNGEAYFNIHTSVVGSGEIRGFLVQTPEPATFGLLGVGLATLWMVRRRRRQ